MIVSTKKPKSDDKVKQQGEKEGEINAELAPNEEITKEAEAIEGVSAPTIARTRAGSNRNCNG